MTITNAVQNLDDAVLFLEKLSGCKNGSFTFQTFDDEGKGRSELIRVFHGTFDEHKEELVRLNNEGAGVFVTVQETDLTGRKERNIKSLRALFVDKDDGHFSGDWALKPSIIVETANGAHAYWLLKDGQPIAEFKTTQKGIIGSLKTDAAVCDLARVMRLVGFMHQKDPANPFLVKMIEANSVQYTLKEIQSAYPFKYSNPVPSGPTYREGRWEEGTRNTTLFSQGMKLRDFGFPSVAIEEALLGMNRTQCNPPLDESEVRQVSNSVLSRPLDSAVSSFHVESLDYYFQNPPVAPEAVIEDLLYRGYLSILSARPKVGKSTLARFLASEISNGGEFLGRKAIQGSTLYIAMEEHSYNLYADFKAMNANPKKIYIASNPVNRKQLEHQIRDLIVVYKPDLVIIDTMIHVINVLDLNDYSKVTLALQPILDFTRKSNAHVMLIHHSTKGGVGNAGVLGSSAIIGMVDTILTMDSNILKKRTLSSSQRSGKPFEDIVLEFDEDTKSFSLGAAQGGHSRDYEKEIKQTLSCYGFQSEEDVKTRLKGKASFIGSALRRLASIGDIDRKGSGKKGDPFIYSLPSVLDEEENE